MTFEGMDPQKVLAAAKVLQVEQANLDTVAASLTKIVKTMRTSWMGPNGERFCADATRAQTQCKNAGTKLGKLGQRAIDNAVAQIATSDQYGAGGGGGAGGTPSRGAIQTALNEANALWNGVSVNSDGSFSVGPHSGYSASSTVFGIPVSSSGDAWAGANGEYHAGAGASLKGGAYANASGQFLAGAGADFNASIGNHYFTASDEAHVLAGVQANGDASAKIGWTSASVVASGSVLAGVDANNHTYLGNKFVNNTTDLDAMAGAKADGDAGASVSLLGGEAHAGGEAFAGAQATAGTAVDVGGAKADGSVTAEAGVGVDGHVDGAFGLNDVGGDIDLGGALGVGLKVHLGFHVDPIETLSDAGSLAKSGFHAVTSLF